MSCQLHSAAALTIGYEAVFTSEPVWAMWRRENSCSYRGSNSDPSAVQPVASRYNVILYRFIRIRENIFIL
jgi:hypothetical protein